MSQVRTDQANAYREEMGFSGGLVIFFGSEIAAWVKDLNGRCTYVPGCIAVDETGNEWVALGGNDYDGAERWEQAV